LGWSCFDYYSFETAAAGTVPRDQSAVRWRTGPVGCPVLEMQMTVAFAKMKQDNGNILGHGRKKKRE